MSNMLVFVEACNKLGKNEVSVRCADPDFIGRIVREAVELLLNKIGTVVDCADYTISTEMSIYMKAHDPAAISDAIRGETKMTLAEYGCGCTWVGKQGEAAERCVRHGDGQTAISHHPNVSERGQGWNALADF